MKGMLVLHLLLYLVFLTAWSATGHVAMPMRAHLTHIDSGRGFTKRDLLRRMAARTRARVDKRWSPLVLQPPPLQPRPPPPPLQPQPQPPPPPPPPSGGDTGVTTAWVSRGGTVGDRDSEYLIHFGIGTPRQPVALTLDTSSDLIWTQCACKSCFDQPFQFLDTSASSSLRHVPCTDRVCAWGGLPLSGCTVHDNMCFYVHRYGDDTFTTGKLSEDTFTFQAASGSGKPVRFGCGMYNTGNFKSNESGMAGFGRGLLSLPKQLNVTRFSYCFTAINESGNSNSSVFLGTYGSSLSAQAQSTPFARGPKGGPNSSLYYLSLLGVTVGTKRLPFDASTFGLKNDGSGGTIIDSGTGITTFPRAVFRTLRGEFESQMSLPVTDGSSADPDSMLCFSSSSIMPGQATIPPLILHLEGADWNLTRGNYVLDSSEDNTTCVVINSSGDNGITIIGNFQQQNMHIAYDLASNKLLFEPARCNQL